MFWQIVGGDTFWPHERVCENALFATLVGKNAPHTPSWRHERVCENALFATLVGKTVPHTHGWRHERIQIPSPCAGNTKTLSFVNAFSSECVRKNHLPVRENEIKAQRKA